MTRHAGGGWAAPGAEARRRASLRRQRIALGVVAALMVGLGIGIPLGRYLTTPPIDGGPARPMSYQVLYRTATSATPGSTTRAWELLTVQRPFDASDLTYSRRPSPGARPEGGAAFTRDRLYAFSGGAFRVVSGRQLGPPGYDQDLLTQMPELEARGLARSLGRSETVAGRACSLYEFREPPSGAIQALGGNEHDDECIDSQGLVLADTWTLGGRVVQTKEAVRVTVGPVQQPFATGPASLPPAAVVQAKPDPRVRSFLPRPYTPPGFRALPPESLVESDPQGTGALLATEVEWAFTKGPNVITVEAGTSAPGQLPWNGEKTVTEPLTLEGLGRARSALRSDGAEIQVSLGDGQWVRIRGTVPLAGLVRYADGLAPPA